MDEILFHTTHTLSESFNLQETSGTLIVCRLDTSTEAGEESDDGGEEGSENTSAETGKERRESGDEAGEDGSDEANDEGEDLGEDLEDGVEDRDELGLETGDGDDGLDSSEDLGDEDNNEVEDLVDVRVGDVEASSTGELGDDLGKLEVDTLEAGDGLVGTLRLGEVTGLDLVSDAAEARGLALDAGSTALEDGEKLANVGDVSLGGRSSGLVNDLVDAELLEDVLEVQDGTADLLGVGRSVDTGIPLDDIVEDLSNSDILDGLANAANGTADHA
jgi:hypothetical protein